MKLQSTNLPGERALLEETPREHALRLVQRERQQLARDLHDVVAHSVAIAVHKVELCQLYRERAGRQAEPELTAALAELRRCLAFVREFARGLRMSHITADISAALRCAVDALGETAARTRICIDGDENVLPPQMRVELVLVLREALLNAHKHSGATAVDVQADVDHNGVRACVTDNGRGLPASVTWGGGVASMRERVELLGGQLVISSRPGAGTTVRLEVPSVGGGR